MNPFDAWKTRNPALEQIEYCRCLACSYDYEPEDMTDLSRRQWFDDGRDGVCVKCVALGFTRSNITCDGCGKVGDTILPLVDQQAYLCAACHK